MSSAPLAALLLAASCFCVDGHHVPEGDVPLAHVHYTVWDGREHAIKVCGDIGLLLPENSTFYTVMTDAARISAYFRFKSDVMHGQHYITSIGGKKYDQKKGYYWMIYKLPYHPDPSVPPKEVLLTPQRRGQDLHFGRRLLPVLVEEGRLGADEQRHKLISHDVARVMLPTSRKSNMLLCTACFILNQQQI